MDIQLAGFSGIEIVEKIRGCNIEIPIIAITAFAVEGKDMQEIIAKGFNDCILKPTSINTLIETISKYIK